MRSVTILGSTGSIGTQALDVVRRHPDRFRVVGLGAATSHELLVGQVREFMPPLVAIADADVIWVDEFDRLWITEADMTELKNRGRTVYAISPEIHGFSNTIMTARWAAIRPRLIRLCPTSSSTALVPFSVALITGKMAYWAATDVMPPAWWCADSPLQRRVRT